MLVSLFCTLTRANYARSVNLMNHENCLFVLYVYISDVAFLNNPCFTAQFIISIERPSSVV